MFKIPKIGSMTAEDGSLDSDAMMAKMEKGLERGIQPKQSEYYWVKTIRNGKLVVLGAYNTQEEAESIGYSSMDGNYEVITLHTRDQGRATQIIKAKLLEQTKDLDLSLERASHKKTF